MIYIPNSTEIAKATNLDLQRKSYIENLAKMRDRNVFCYYSGFLTVKTGSLAIDDFDKNGFMTCFSKADKSKGLDLILHTPGGDLAAVDSLIRYIKSIVGKDFVVIVPQIAMSAGTMIACSAKEIIMGKQSNLGPVDPQIGGFSAEAVLNIQSKGIEELKQAKKEELLAQNSPNAAEKASGFMSKHIFWDSQFKQISPLKFENCERAIEWADEMLNGYLSENIFSELAPNEKNLKIKKVLETLGSHQNSKNHARHFHMDELKELGLNIVELESNNNLQDAVLSVHHCYMHTFNKKNVSKIIESDKDAILTFRA